MGPSVVNVSAEETFSTDTVSDTNDTKRNEAMTAVGYYSTIFPATLTDIVTGNGLM